MSQDPSQNPITQANFDAASKLPPVEFRGQQRPTRVLLSDSMHYIGAEGQPTSWENKTCLNLTQEPDDEREPYSRKIKLTEKWAEIDTGWLSDSSISIIRVQNFQGNPTGVLSEKELQELKGTRVILGVKLFHPDTQFSIVEFASIPVNCAFTLFPSSVIQSYMIRGSRSGMKATVTLIQE